MGRVFNFVLKSDHLDPFIDFANLQNSFTYLLIIFFFQEYSSFFSKIKRVNFTLCMA
jgi:hypothetical protein